MERGEQWIRSVVGLKHQRRRFLLSFIKAEVVSSTSSLMVAVMLPGTPSTRRCCRCWWNYASRCWCNTAAHGAQRRRRATLLPSAHRVTQQRRWFNNMVITRMPIKIVGMCCGSHGPTANGGRPRGT